MKTSAPASHPRLRRLRRWLRAPALLILVFLIWFLAQRPSLDRDWQPGLDRLPRAEFQGDTVHIQNVRNFRTQPDHSRLARYEDRTYDLSQVESLWYILSIFNGDGWRGPAHSMLSFGFADGRFLVVSVEARKEVGEDYSVWLGAVRRFEMMYVVGDERDMLLDRCAFRDDIVHMYPIVAQPDQIARLLRDMLTTANTLREKPRFYNTLTGNCTSKLRDEVNNVFPHRIPPTWKVVLPGYTDTLLRDLGLLKGETEIDKIRTLYRVDEIGAAIGDVPEFSRLIREGLPGT
jgi:hypothetical protein